MVVVQKAIHSEVDNTIGNYLPTVSDATKDFNGYNNTQNIIRFNIAKGSNTTTYAAPYCKSYVFPDGSKDGYIPAYGELATIMNNRTNINACMTVCGGNQLPSNNIWSSTYFGIVSSSYGCLYTYSNQARHGVENVLAVILIKNV